MVLSDTGQVGAHLLVLRDDGSERFGCEYRFREIHYESQRGAGALGTRADKWFKLGPTLGLKLAVSSKTIAAESVWMSSYNRQTPSSRKTNFPLSLGTSIGKTTLRACPALNNTISRPHVETTISRRWAASLNACLYINKPKRYGFGVLLQTCGNPFQRIAKTFMRDSLA